MASDNTLMAAQVKTGGKSFELGPVRPLFRTSIQTQIVGFSYDVSADGQRIIANVTAEQASAPITLVVNWTAGLRR